MAFPSVASKGTTYTTGGTAATDHVIDLPNGLAAGDRVVICAGIRSNTAFTWPTSPAWTEIAAVAAPTSGGRLEVRYHDVTGSEGWTDGSSITVTTASAKGVAFSWRIAGHDPATAPAAATATSSASANPDPPNLDPASWGTEDTLWMAVSYSNANNTTSVYPTDFADNQENAVATGASAASARICSRNANAANQDPSAFTISAAQNSATATIAIRPIVATPVEAAAASVIPAATQTVTAAATVEAAAGSSVVAVTQSTTAMVEVTGATASTIPAVTQAAAGVLAVSAAAGSVVPALTQAATGTSAAVDPGMAAPIRAFIKDLGPVVVRDIAVRVVHDVAPIIVEEA